MITAFINLRVSPAKIFKASIILDPTLISLGITTIAFFAMMQILDRGKWEMKILQLAYVVGVVTKTLNVKIILLYMKWGRTQLIIYKIVLNIMALCYFSVGVYCFFTNYSFTFNILKKFDQQCRYFVVLFTFSAFDLCCRLIKLMSVFDYTDKFKYDYVMKDVKEERAHKQQQIVKSFRHLNIEKKDQKSVHFIPVVKLQAN